MNTKQMEIWLLMKLAILDSWSIYPHLHYNLCFWLICFENDSVHWEDYWSKYRNLVHLSFCPLKNNFQVRKLHYKVLQHPSFWGNISWPMWCNRLSQQLVCRPFDSYFSINFNYGHIWLLCCGSWLSIICKHFIQLGNCIFHC
jgi:hypothetical protein